MRYRLNTILSLGFPENLEISTRVSHTIGENLKNMFKKTGESLLAILKLYLKGSSETNGPTPDPPNGGG